MKIPEYLEEVIGYLEGTERPRLHCWQCGTNLFQVDSRAPLEQRLEDPSWHGNYCWIRRVFENPQQEWAARIELVTMALYEEMDGTR